jgi:hypothetical protein
MRVCTHTHTHENGTSLLETPGVCIQYVERERQTLGRIVGHREVPLHRRWEVGCLDFFFLPSLVILSYLEVPTFRGNTHTHTPKDWRKRWLENSNRTYNKWTTQKKGKGAIVCLFHSIVYIFIEVTRICIEWEFRVLAQFLTHLLFEMKRVRLCRQQGGRGNEGDLHFFCCFGYVLYVRQCLCVSFSILSRLFFFFFTCCWFSNRLDILALYYNMLYNNNACAVVRHLFAGASLPRAQIDRATPLGQ